MDSKKLEILMPAIREFLRANANLENEIQAIAEQKTEVIRILPMPVLLCI